MSQELRVNPDSMKSGLYNMIKHYSTEKTLNNALQIQDMIFNIIRAYNSEKKDEVFLNELSQVLRSALDKEGLDTLSRQSNTVKVILEKIKPKTLSRRRFLKASSAAGVLVALGLGKDLISPNQAQASIPKKGKDYLLEHKYIIYHQTDGFDKGVRETLTSGGVSIHYLIYRDGTVESLVPEDKVAVHTGPTFWDGLQDISKRSIGIECVDCRTGDLTQSQYSSLKKLIKDIQRRYNIPDENVLPHAMVRIYHSGKKKIRGGRICGMGFNRSALALRKIPKDKSVEEGKVGRNSVIDELYALANDYNITIEQRQIQFGNISTLRKGVTPWQIAGNEYNRTDTIYYNPNEVIKGYGNILAGNEIVDWSNLREGTKVYRKATKNYVLIEHNQPVDIPKQSEDVFVVNNEYSLPVKELGQEAKSPHTLYIIPLKKMFGSNSLIVNGSNITKEIIKEGTVVLTKVKGDPIDVPRRGPYSLAGKLHNTDKVAYIFPKTSEVKLGNDNNINTSQLPKNTKIVFRDVA